MTNGQITNQEQLTKSEQFQNEYSTEASDLGLRPGQWPAKLENHIKLGNGAVFERVEAMYNGFGSDRELVGYKYKQYMGDIVITVYND